MTVSTQRKYEDANNAAQQSTSKPADVARKFLEAKKSASTIEEETKILKVLQETELKTKDQLNKLIAVINNVDEAQGTIATGRELESNGLTLMQGGVDNLYLSCKDSLYFCSTKDNQGLKTFEKGLNELSSSNDKYFNKVLSALKQGDK
jgi:phage shock protein A